jgi:gluconolactonase
MTKQSCAWLLATQLLAGPIAAQAQGAGARTVSIQTIAGVVAGGARWQMAWQGTNNADGIVGLDDGSLLFAQEQPRLVGRLDQSDRYGVYLADTRGVGSLAVDRAGRLLGVERTCTDPGRPDAPACKVPTAVSILAPEHEVLADSLDGTSLGRLNDLVVDAHGNAYFTAGHAYMVTPTGRVVRLDEDLRTNGIMLSPDERTLYVTNRDAVVAFDLTAEGLPGRRRDFATLEAGGVGDGMAVDEDGRLYVTSAPGVQVFDPDGAFLGLIPTPRPAISVAFAGPRKQRLYVVGSGAALGPEGTEFVTPRGVRNNAKTLYRVEMIARGFAGRAK